MANDFTKHFSNLGIADIATTGGKNASLGEMYAQLTSRGIAVPEGFATTADAYRLFITENGLSEILKRELQNLDVVRWSNLQEVGNTIRTAFLKCELPQLLVTELLPAYEALKKNSKGNITVAVRSSATAEDLPGASFAGQQETYLNVKSAEQLLRACVKCYASLFTDRAIKYRHDNGFDHEKVALSIGVQVMVRADKGCSGVMFSIDPDSGFKDVVLVSGAWGLGENVVQGAVNPDEFLVYTPFLESAGQPIIQHKLGSKQLTMVYAEDQAEIAADHSTINIATKKEAMQQFVLNDQEVIQLARWALIIREHYGRAMDIEWAKDGMTNELFILQARPETVHSRDGQREYRNYILEEEGELLCKGAGLGQGIVSGVARVLHSPLEVNRLNEGEILITERTDPDWDPVMKKAAAIVTDTGGRTSHAAIVARELGALAVVGAGNATAAIADGDTITVSTAKGNVGEVYKGKLLWTEEVIDMSTVPKTKTKVMLILAHPEEAFHHAQLPSDGVGLMRMEFIISSSIGIHPMALFHFGALKDASIRQRIDERTAHFVDKKEFFVQTLAESVARIAAAFYPKDVIVRMSDFKSNEYAHLLGGELFEPAEENPMMGFRGASRYYHPLYKDGFALECAAMKRVREAMGFTNVKLMIPFCRTVKEAQKVLEVMQSCGLQRGVNGLEVYVMIEIPSNALQAEEFAKYFDGFSIGSNDLTQLTLGADRDSELLSEIFSPFDPAVLQLIAMTLEKAKLTHTHTGLCGQAPSDYPEYARFLVRKGIDSISFNPDALIKGIENIAAAEKELNSLN